ncbi:hypothetical protein L1077_20680 [Pseudoalteromonas luteoviolacea]|uniref:hypothetical protein n=1 Tax=Pseudoalteromonas luteoviolacea TaxID=43657 RepID=UPI001F449AD2|nr:hypothetical protein [Pseudoalteromonas luteoviolacea]MCF6441856.1 hypothetical protein [Pseudoalteromonas luteoviolacea]
MMGSVLMDILLFSALDTLLGVTLSGILWCLYVKLKSFAQGESADIFIAIGNGCKFLSFSIFLPLLFEVILLILLGDGAQRYLIYAVDVPYYILTILASLYFFRSIRYIKQKSKAEA